MGKAFIALAVAAAVTGCASTHMEQFVDQDIREVVMVDGPPENVFDFGPARRVFQFRWGGGSYVLPESSTMRGQAYRIGSTVYGHATTSSIPARQITSDGCLLSYITEWDANREGWIVRETRYPDRLVC
ncbi:MAG: hypothetical protein ACJA0Y_000899 [Maricaulis maris]|jgi:hypothetical protein